MGLNVGKEIAALKRMTVGELRERYAEVFGEETHARNKQWLVKRVIWRLQSMSEGSLSERARARAAELANDADLRRRPPKQLSATTKAVAQEASSDRRLPIPGTLITREYSGHGCLRLVRAREINQAHGGGLEVQGSFMSGARDMISSSDAEGEARIEARE